MTRNTKLMLVLSLAGLVWLGCGSDEADPPESITVEQPEDTLETNIEQLPEADPDIEAKIEALVAQLNDESAEIRRTATLSLAKLHHPATVPGLIKAFNDADSEIRAIAADALATIGEPAVGALIRELGRVPVGDDGPLREVCSVGLCRKPVHQTDR